MTATPVQSERAPEQLPRCCVCNKAVDRVRIYVPLMLEPTLRTVVECHGAVEVHDIDATWAVIYRGRPMLEPLAFLRPVATYGAVSNDARRERRQRLRRA